MEGSGAVKSRSTLKIVDFREADLGEPEMRKEKTLMICSFFGVIEGHLVVLPADFDLAPV